MNEPEKSLVHRVLHPPDGFRRLIRNLRTGQHEKLAIRKIQRPRPPKK